MPHAGKCSDEQEAVYQEIAKLIKAAKDSKFVCANGRSNFGLPHG